MSYIKLDAKDKEILRELDINFRQSFSKIGRKVGLSKNSVGLRFEKLKECMLHNTLGLNNELLGYTMIKVYYSFDFYNENTELEIIKELKKHRNLLWAARYYGEYDVGTCFLVNNLNDFIEQATKFDEKFANKINRKEIELVSKQIFFRHNFIHDREIPKYYKIEKTNKILSLTDIEKRILKTMRYEPRMSIIDIVRKTGLSTKTITSRLKQLEKTGIIMGYFMTLDHSKLDYNVFKLLIQIHSGKTNQEFDDYLSSLKETKYMVKMLGSWDYEVDLCCRNIRELQNKIEMMKEKFPNMFKKIGILSFGKRIATNKESFLF